MKILGIINTVFVILLIIKLLEYCNDHFFNVGYILGAVVVVSLFTTVGRLMTAFSYVDVGLIISNYLLIYVCWLRLKHLKNRKEENYE